MINLKKQAYEELSHEIKSSAPSPFSKFEDFKSSKAIIEQGINKISKKYDEETITSLKQETLGYGPLESLLDNDSVSEIIINSYNEIYYEESLQFKKHESYFSTVESYKQFIRKLATEANIKYDLNTPFSNGQWNNFRVHLIAPPLATNNIQITLRRIKKNGWSLNEFFNSSFFTQKQLDKLVELYSKKYSLLIVGPTGTGKTSLANALLKLSRPLERIVCLEDTDELKLPNTLSTKLLTRTDLNKKLKDYDLSDLIVQSLRMRPDRLILGEVRGKEAKDLLMAFSTGHKGGIATLHADNPMQALWRLEMLVQMGAPSWSTEGIRRLIKLGIDYVITLGFEEGQRKLTGIHKIQSLEPTGFLFKNET